MTQVKQSTEALMVEVRQLLGKDAEAERVDQRGARKAAFAKQIAAQREATANRRKKAEHEIYASTVESVCGLIPVVGDFIGKTMITNGSEVREEILNAATPDLGPAMRSVSTLLWTGPATKPGTALEEKIEDAAEIEERMRPGEDTVFGVISKADRSKAADAEEDAGKADTAATEAQERVEDAKEFLSEARDLRKQVLENAKAIEAELREAKSAINDI